MAELLAPTIPEIGVWNSPSFLDKVAIQKVLSATYQESRRPSIHPPLSHINMLSRALISTDMTILDTPGHTPDEVTLYDEAKMVLIRSMNTSLFLFQAKD